MSQSNLALFEEALKLVSPLGHLKDTRYIFVVTGKRYSGWLEFVMKFEGWQLNQLLQGATNAGSQYWVDFVTNANDLGEAIERWKQCGNRTPYEVKNAEQNFLRRLGYVVREIQNRTSALWMLDGEIGLSQLQESADPAQGVA